MKKIVFFLVLLTAIVVAIAPFCLDRSEILGQTHYYSSLSPLKKFSSYEELKSFVKASSQAYPYYFERSFPQVLSFATDTENAAKGYSVPGYSTTNIQVEEVDEADVVKTDGEYIYVVSGKNVVIVKASPAEEAEVLSRIELNGTLRELFINGDRLAVFEERGFNTYHGYEKFISYEEPTTYEAPRAFIRVYDVSDRTNPTSARNVSLDGYYFNSRMIGEYAYVVINQPAYYLKNEVALPKIRSGNRVEEISASTIHYSDVPDYSYTFTTIVAISLEKDEQEPTHETFLLGATSCMYVSLNDIYITFWKHGEKTLIYRIRIEEEKIKCEAGGEVPGHALNQFSMDEYDGHFRIATTTWMNGTSQNNVYVLDMNLDIVGRLEGLAPGETIYSARLMGDRCYLVTFRQVDPFFVIDLKDPSIPKVLGQLKIPGFSSYPHPYDQKHVIGIGKEGANVKMSLFNVSNVSDPKEVGKYLVGGQLSDTPVLTDHKAFLFDKSKNLLVIPISIKKTGVYKDSLWQGVYVFNITLHKELVLKGEIAHFENDAGPWSIEHWVKRSLYIDNVLYTISDKKIKMNSLENLEEINEVEFL